MIERLRSRFAGDACVMVIVHDFDNTLPTTLGTFDAVVSSFAIHM
jgi:hypothetical protein